MFVSEQEIFNLYREYLGISAKLLENDPPQTQIKQKKVTSYTAHIKAETDKITYIL